MKNFRVMHGTEEDEEEEADTSWLYGSVSWTGFNLDTS
jgi:hypothetical protein